MSFLKTEHFPFTHETTKGDIIITSDKQMQTVVKVYSQLDAIFNDNARIKSCR